MGIAGSFLWVPSVKQECGYIIRISLSNASTKICLHSAVEAYLRVPRTGIYTEPRVLCPERAWWIQAKKLDDQRNSVERQMYLPSRIDNIPPPGARIECTQATRASGLGAAGLGCSGRLGGEAHYHSVLWCGGDATPRSCGLHSSHACTRSRVTLPPLASLLQSSGYMGFNSEPRAVTRSCLGATHPEGHYGRDMLSSAVGHAACYVGRQSPLLPLGDAIAPALPPKPSHRCVAGNAQLRRPVLPIVGPAASPRYETNKTCLVCGRRCTRPSTLKTHMLIHTGELPFQCSWPGCSKRFNVRSNMNRHVNSHKRRLMKESKKKSSSPGAGML
ncbi:ADL040Wp [Eremothecium gossypii ATCC 10895]|uniref:ADL040Wp n=1 Tax=Eremothecium gossypii (strain ATCC 10895 / CBS 109.51 / FGSC 9923 / NRRL Y-1056) TaxID=284811 RepID=Q75AF8_EREGS|nr:ADL040Wp [Eremothecium gossypii ATCC 10895]AAS51880.2 ADL040Wp [Eremothecium gossypii ATCC 10895]